MTYNLLKLKLVKKYPWIGKYLRTNWGFIPEELKETDYIFGLAGVNKKILMPSGDWSEFLPLPERQSGRIIETMACTCFSFLNVLEILFKKKYGLDKNFSDRFLAKMSGVSHSGNVQSRVMDTARNLGLIDEQDWSSNIDDFDWSEYYAPIPGEVQAKAKLFLNDWAINYEAVTPTILAMKEALKYAPLYVAGYAWYYSGGLYHSLGIPNHCFVIYNIEQAIAYKRAYDSYDPFTKKLASDYQVFYPKLITLNKVGESFNTSSILDLIRRGLKYIMRVQGNGEIYELNPEGLRYISPEEWNNINVQMASEQHKLVGITEDFYNNLLL